MRTFDAQLFFDANDGHARLGNRRDLRYLRNPETKRDMLTV